MENQPMASQMESPQGPAPAESPINYKSAQGEDLGANPVAQEQLTSKLMGKFNAWYQWRLPFHNVWAEIYRLFIVAPNAQRVATRSHVVIPVVFQILEAALPKIMNIIFDSAEWFSVVSRSAAKPIKQELLDAKHDLIYYQLDKAKFFMKYLIFLKQMFLYGTSYFHVCWKVKREWVYERTPIRQDITESGITIKQNALSWKSELVYKVVERRPEVEVLDVADVYPDPESKDEDQSQGVFVASTMQLEEFKELCQGKYPVYTNYEQVEATTGSRQDSLVRIMRRALRGVAQPSPVTQGKQVELLTFWGKEDLDGDGIREEVQIVIANRKVLVKCNRNPYEHQKRPIIRGVLFPVPNEWYGMGLIEPIIPLVQELNTIRGQNIDMNNLIINRMWKVDTMADVDLETLISAPNAIILTGNMDGIEALHQDPIPGSVTEMSVMIQTDIENTTTPKSIQGAPSGGSLGRTARGAQMIIGQALEKFGMGAKLLEETTVEPLLNMFDQLNAQFLDSDEVLQEFYGDLLLSPEADGTLRLTPEQIRADVSYEFQGVSETVTREATINQLLAWYNTFKDVLGPGAIESAKVAWKLMKINVPVEAVIQPQTTMTPELAAAMQMAPGVGPDAVEAQIEQNGASGLQIPK